MKHTIIAIAISVVSFSTFAGSNDYIGAGDFREYKSQQTQLNSTQDNTLKRLGLVNIDQDKTLDNHEGRITFLENNKPADGKDGKDGINGTDGKDGKDGINGVDGTNGRDGTNGLDGNNGKDGLYGKDGLSGSKGDNGETGANGSNGIDGTNGKNGLDGKDADVAVTNKNTSDIKGLTIDVSSAQSRADELDSRIIQQKAEQAKTNASVASNTKQLANHEQRISSIESQVNSGFSDLKNKIDDNEDKANAAISGVAAMANIPQVTEYQSFAVGAGVGTREGESALAVGFSARASQNTVIKTSVATDTQQSFTIGAGVSYGW